MYDAAGVRKFFWQNNLDVEFAFSEEDRLYILQVRTLGIQGEPADQEQQEKELIRMREKYNKTGAEYISYARRLNEAMLAASSIEVGAADENLDK